MTNRTLVTDCAANMPVIVGANVSENLWLKDERWLGWVVHQLNTVLKHTFVAKIV